MLSVALECHHCGWRTVCGSEEVARRLRKIGLLRRSPNPPDDLVSELMRVNSRRLTCDQCQRVGLGVVGADDTGPAGFSLGDDWQQARICEICRQPIPEERLAVLPNATRCVACQDAADRGKEPAAPEYCPKCGALLELRVSYRGGIAHYRQFCTGLPPCRL
jgi:hypothetical protein